MKFEEVKVGDRCLVQSGREVREIAVVKAVINTKKTFLCKLADNTIAELEPRYILKSFGAL